VTNQGGGDAQALAQKFHDFLTTLSPGERTALTQLLEGEQSVADEVHGYMMSRSLGPSTVYRGTKCSSC
jgi:hypothetical protein